MYGPLQITTHFDSGSVWSATISLLGLLHLNVLQLPFAPGAPEHVQMNITDTSNTIAVVFGLKAC